MSCWGSGEIVFSTGGIMLIIQPKICGWDRAEVQVRSCFSQVRSFLELDRSFAGEIMLTLRFRWWRSCFPLVRSCLKLDRKFAGKIEIVFYVGEILFETWSKLCRWDRVEVQVRSCFSLMRSCLKFDRKFKFANVFRWWDRVEVQVRSSFALERSCLKLNHKFPGEIMLRLRWDRVLHWWDRVWYLNENLQVRSCWGSGEIVFLTGEITFET